MAPVRTPDGPSGPTDAPGSRPAMSTPASTPSPVSSGAKTPAPVWVALAGSFVASMSAQFSVGNLMDIQGSIGATADEASWLATLYPMACFFGIVTSGNVVRWLGLRRYFLTSAALLALPSWLGSLASSLPELMVLRAMQGLAAGGFGPVAFVAIFMLCKGPKLPYALAQLAFVLVVSVTAGPIIAGYVESFAGWRSLYLLQFLLVLGLWVAGTRWLPPPSALNREALKADWVAMVLMIVALALTILVFSQGTRRFWLESGLIVWAIALCAATWMALVWSQAVASTPVVRAAKLLDPRFGWPIALNLIFRISLAFTAYLIPQLLLVAQGYRPLEVSEAMLWCLLPQIAAFPAAWYAMKKLDARAVMLLGLLACGVAAAIGTTSSVLSGGEQLRLLLVLFGIGQMFFLVPNLVVGAGSLEPRDLATASLAFNATTVGGTTLGIGLASQLMIDRTRLHLDQVAEHASRLSPWISEKVDILASNLINAAADEAFSGRVAVSITAASMRREATVMAANDVAFMVAISLVISGLMLAGIDRCPPLQVAASAGEKSA